MCQLSKHAWSYRKLTEHTKIQIYKPCVLRTVLCGCETWNMHAHHEERLGAFHMRQLRYILGITWEDKISNKCACKIKHSFHVHAAQAELLAGSYVVRMKDDRAPKDILFGELGQGTRPCRRLTWDIEMYVCKRDLLALGIDNNTREAKGAHGEFRYAISNGLSDFEQQLRLRYDLKRT